MLLFYRIISSVKEILFVHCFGVVFVLFSEFKLKCVEGKKRCFYIIVSYKCGGDTLRHELPGLTEMILRLHRKPT